MEINIFLPLSWKREEYRELKEQKGVVGGRGDRMGTEVVEEGLQRSR